MWEEQFLTLYFDGFIFFYCITSDVNELTSYSNFQIKLIKPISLNHRSTENGTRVLLRVFRNVIKQTRLSARCYARWSRTRTHARTSARTLLTAAGSGTDTTFQGPRRCDGFVLWSEIAKYYCGMLGVGIYTHGHWNFKHVHVSTVGCRQWGETMWGW